MSSPETVRPSPLSDVLGRLKEHVAGEHKIHERAKTIGSLVGQFEKRPDEAEEQLKKSLWDIRIGLSSKEPFENAAAAFLIMRLQEQKRSSGQDFSLRPDQIEGIVVLLEKSHLQAKTGYGKSAFVLPIASLVSSLSENGRIAVAAPSPEAKTELLNAIDEISKLLPVWLRPKIYEFMKSKGFQEDETQADLEERFRDFARLIFKTPINEEVKLSDEAQRQQRNGFFRSLFPIPDHFRNVDDSSLEILPAPGEPTVSVFEENDVVFHSLHNPKPENGFDHVYFDDVHVPRSRNTVYYTTEPSTFLTPQAVEEFLFKRFLAQFLKEVVEEEKLFARNENGAYWFKDDQAQERVGDLLKNITADGREDVTKYRGLAASLFGKQLQIEEPAAVESWLKSWFENRSRSFDDKSLDDLGSEILLSLSGVKAIKEGVHYLHSEKKSSPAVRDYFMGLMLPSHRFNPEDVLGIQACDDTLSFADYYQTSQQSTSFEGWVTNILHGKITGLTNNLFTPRLDATDIYQKTGLARFLERATGRPAVFAGEKPTSYVPTPLIVEDGVTLKRNLINTLTADPHQRQTLIFCFDENEAAALKEAIEQSFPADKKEKKNIFIADASIDEIEARKRYQQFVEDDFAILISTGRVGVGVDLKKSDGQFPDYKTIIYGVPFTSDQIFQAMGRRRRPSTHPEADFIWLLSKDQLKDYPAFQYQYPDAGSEKKFFAQLDKNPLSALARLIELSENMSHDNDELLTAFDRSYQDAVAEFDKRVRRRAIRRYGQLEEKLGLEPAEKKILGTFVGDIWGKSLKDFYADFIQAPGHLYWLLRNQLSLMAGQSSAGALLIESVRSYFSRPENFKNWVDARTDQFEYLIKEIIISQLQSSQAYEKMKTARNLRFVRTAFLPIQGDFDFIKQGYFFDENGETVYKSAGSAYLVVNLASGQPLILEKGESLGVVYDFPESMLQITTVLSS